MSTIALPSGLPTPVRVRTPETDTSPYSDKRTYEFVFTADGGVLPEFGGEDVENGLRLTITHDRHRKAYEAEVKVLTVRAHSTMEAFTFRGPRKDATLATAPAARFSRKALDTFAATVVADFPASIPADSEPGRMWARITAAAVPVAVAV